MKEKLTQDLFEAMKLHASYRLIMEVSACIVEVEKHSGLISPHKIGFLEGYRLHLLRLISQKNVLSPLASASLAALNHAIEFVKTRNPSSRKAMIAEYKKGDQIAIKLTKEGVFNGN